MFRSRTNNRPTNSRIVFNANISLQVRIRSIFHSTGMVNLNQITIETKNAFIDWNFTSCIKLLAFFKLLQFPTASQLFDVSFIDFFICISRFYCYRGILFTSFFLQFLRIIVVNVTHALKNRIFVIGLFIRSCRYFVIVWILFENQLPRHHGIDNGVSQRCYHENRY